MDKAIEVVRKQLLEADRQYDAKNIELYRACREGSMAEQRKLRKEEKVLWDKRQVLANLIVELQKERTRTDQSDFEALMGAFGGRK